MKSNWIKNNNEAKWKRFVKINNEIVEEYSSTETILENHNLSNMKNTSIKDGLVIYTKWRIIGDNKWHRLIKYPWNEIENEITDVMPLEYKPDNSPNNIDKPESIVNYTILENRIETNSNNDESSWIDRNDGTKYWVRHMSVNDNSVRETTHEPQNQPLELCEDLEEIKNKEDAIKKNEVKYSNWSIRVDRNGEYKRRYITWPWGEVEREIIRTNNMI